MEKGDLLTLAAGIIIVLVLAIMAHPEYLSGPAPVIPSLAPDITPVRTAAVIADPRASIPTAAPTPVPTIAPPYRIFYSSSPFSFPRFKMPENTGIFGADDIPLRGREMVTFAYISDAKGGLTQKFSVPYPIWAINTTVTANRTPQYGNFQMVLCYGNNGTVIDGMEILNRGSMMRVIQASGTDVYMIITTAYIDSFRIELETPKEYYDQYRQQ